MSSGCSGQRLQPCRHPVPPQRPLPRNSRCAAGLDGTTTGRSCDSFLCTEGPPLPFESAVSVCESLSSLLHFCCLQVAKAPKRRPKIPLQVLCSSPDQSLTRRLLFPEAPALVEHCSAHLSIPATPAHPRLQTGLAIDTVSQGAPERHADPRARGAGDRGVAGHPDVGNPEGP